MANASPKACGGASTTRAGIDFSCAQSKNDGVNIKKYGAVIAAATCILTGCVPKLAISRPGIAIMAAPYDKLDNWIDPMVPPTVINRGDLGLDAILMITQPSLAESYYGIGLLGDRCLAVLQYHVGLWRVEVFSRYDDSLSENVDDALPKQEAAFWLLPYRTACTTQIA